MKTLNDLRLIPGDQLKCEPTTELGQQMLDVVRYGGSFGSLAPCLALKAAEYHLGTGGQRIRAVLALHAGKRLGLTQKNALFLAVACELLHNASLIHDDLHDRDPLRRGQDSVWHKFGDEVAICAGDLLLSASYLALSQLVDITRMPALFALMHARIATAIRGQCADLKRPTHRVVTIDDFKNIALTKSGALLSLPIELAMLAAGQDRALVPARQAAAAFAIAYQIHDDLVDMDSDACRNPVRPSATNQTADSTACNIVLILQSDVDCADAKLEAKRIGFEQLSLATSSCADLPLNSGDALHAMCLQLHDELECLE